MDSIEEEHIEPLTGSSMYNQTTLKKKHNSNAVYAKWATFQR
jgi:hypothetical protein